MTTPIAQTVVPPRRLFRSAGALFLGFVAVVVLSLGTDQVLHLFNVYPRWGEPMYDSGLCMLALSYRIVYTVLGSYVAAKFAPHGPMGHALILGAIGTVVGTLGAIATIPMNLSPAWYPIAIAVTAMPCAWLGGILYRKWKLNI